MAGSREQGNISSSLPTFGYENSLKELRVLYANGHASKEDYANALRAYQAAVDATKSAQRERVEENREVIYF